MKKILLFMMIIMSFTLYACGSNTTNDSVSSNSADTSASAEETADVSEDQSSSNDSVGPYQVVIKDYEVTQDDEGNDAVYVTFDFTNNSDENINFDTAVYGQCFQNGVELDFATVYIGEETTDPLYDNKYKDIQPGTTIEVKEAYILQDKENPISVKVVSMNEILGGQSEGSVEKDFNITE